MNKQTTKWQLATALKDLMQTTALDHITIDMLTKKAKLTRNTFYYHFEDIYALLAWIYQQEIVQQAQAYTNINTWQTVYRLILDYIETNQKFCLESFHSIGRDLLENLLYEVSSDMVQRVIIDVEPNTPAELQKAISNFYGWALTMQVIQWLRNNLTESKDALIRRAEIMLNGTIENAIKNGRQSYFFGQSH
ncbi:TetR/AcrR family transcriptional regulator C-terminal domain-containing protein [Agrilactobacillus yilanensis]|uniref:TetR/AcrR family transcriptional regulator C-terminal domain-containing protein n=1 Tax=Agrilactobacillus yilanensis TaxID=2485997 RepID=A0ABW4J333_9LACO|nr:TetR/AcrR family transcriptional regulator C-terminal domain-containing protein [Agrilactobacillus yilanensis]